MKAKIVFVALFMALFAVSCKPGRVFEQWVDIPNMLWHKDSIVNVCVPVENVAEVYDVKVAVRSNVFYQSRNLWLFIKTYSPQGVVEVDTLECLFADEQGHITGDASGDIIDYEIPFKSTVKFPAAGEYKFALQHGMRIEQLPCIDQIGIIVDKHSVEQ